VIPTWNGGKFVSETIHSLVKQDFPYSQYEIIVVDDGSTDDTLKRLDSFSNRIRIFQQQNLGAASARNKGMQHARGEYIVCFDHDDILFPYALRD
jgi:glycosyltransferase involved in cell wall biosynthesis